jgi:hypothetical protein
MTLITNPEEQGMRSKPILKTMEEIKKKGKWVNMQNISAEWIDTSTRPYVDGNWAG